MNYQKEIKRAWGAKREIKKITQVLLRRERKKSNNSRECWSRKDSDNERVSE